MSKVNFLESILRAAGDEAIEKIIFANKSEFEWNDEEEGDINTQNRPLYGKVQKFTKVQHLFNYNFDNSYGAVECHPIVFWTKTRVFFVVCYDGASWISSVPRNPTDELPHYFGGG